MLPDGVTFYEPHHWEIPVTLLIKADG